MKGCFSVSQNSKKITVYDLVTVGLLAAIIFVATSVLKIGPIPTPAGPTQFKVANALCLLFAMLFGKWRGGLAAGIGSALFDLTNPAFTASAPFTLVFFFLMAFICGQISHAGGREGKNRRWNLTGAIAGAVAYIILNTGKSIILLMLAGSAFGPALAANTTKLITSGVNALFAVVVSVLLAPALRAALEKAGIMQKLHGARC